MERISLDRIYYLTRMNLRGLPIHRQGNLLCYYHNNHVDGFLNVVDVASRPIHGKHKVVMELTLRTDRPAYEVTMVSVDRKYQGFGLAPWAYSVLLNKYPTMIIQSGKMQSPGGRYIWAELSKRDDVRLYALTPRGKIKYNVTCDPITNELWCDDLELYDGHPTVSVFAEGAKNENRNNRNKRRRKPQAA